MNLALRMLAITVIFTRGTAHYLLVLREKIDKMDFNNKSDLVDDASLKMREIYLNRSDMKRSIDEFRSELSIGASIVVDLTWGGWSEAKWLSLESGLPYLRTELYLAFLVRIVNQFLVQVRRANDAAVIFQNQQRLEEGLHHLVELSVLRILTLNGLSTDICRVLIDTRPTPSFNLIFADTPSMNRIFKTAIDCELVRHHDRWLLVVTDFDYEGLRWTLPNVRTTLFTMNKSNTHSTFQSELSHIFLSQFYGCLNETFVELQKSGEQYSRIDNCATNNMSNTCFSTTSFYTQLQNLSWKYPLLYYNVNDSLISPRINVDIKSGTEEFKENIGVWTPERELNINGNVRPIKRFLRIGTGYSVPFAFPPVGSPTNESDSEDGGGRQWVGYCIDFIRRLSMDMDFNYELVTSNDFGRRLPNGTWTGLVGLLASGEIDAIVGALIMTSEREEVIDYVTPYFEQTGLSVVIRRPLRKMSLFKFMTVLKVEVWMSILGALTTTAIMLWFLDKYSPYSAQNNKKAYAYPCRRFTLKESFWLAVTSFTPQGGGEIPKCLSGRALVAAYWLFVVLVLATFTANLAAFLTVERMQSPVKSLEQLSKQSRINYTVVKDSMAHSYFRNMRNAEETLYKMWKEISLNTTSNKFRVWDYPIKEQYGRILTAIEKTQFVKIAEDGFRKVVDSHDAEFALIHDALEIKYNVFKNCDLTVIGEVFAEQPYAVAVQQGSQLNEEFSKKILSLQKQRYFEGLRAKYWNGTVKRKCNSQDDNEGITLESLGGVFIATLVGLLLAMVFLGVEILYQKRKLKTEIGLTSERVNRGFNRDLILRHEFGFSFANKQSLFHRSQLARASLNKRSELY